MTTETSTAISFNLNGIMEYTAQPRWHRRFESIMQAHLGVAAAFIGIDYRGVISALGEPWGSALLYEIFNDFYTRVFGPHQENVVDSYLATEGSAESVWGQKYLRELKKTKLSLYRVGNNIGKSFISMHDLIQRDRVTKVKIEFLSTVPSKDTIMSGRLLNIGGKAYLHGGLIMKSGLSNRRIRDFMNEEIELDGLTLSTSSIISSTEFAPMITSIWIVDAHPSFVLK